MRPRRKEFWKVGIYSAIPEDGKKIGKTSNQILK